MPLTASRTFTYNEVAGLYPETSREEAAAFAANLVLAAGQVLAQITAANVSEVQTFASTHNAGTFAIQFTGGGLTYTTTLLAFNASGAAIQAAVRLLPNIGSAGVNVTGGALGAQPIVITFAGALANQPQPLISIVNNTLSGGALTAPSRTTPGLRNASWVPVDETLVSAPAAPTVAGNGAGSAFGAGTYAVQVAFVTSLGETTPSPATMVTVTAAQNLRVSAINSVNANYPNAPILSATFYVNGVWAATTAVAGGNIAQTDITGSALGTGGIPRKVNNAYASSDGRATAARILRYDIATDQTGAVTFGALATGGEHGETNPSAPTYFKGEFDVQKLTGLTALGVANMGRLISGTAGGPGTLSLS